MKRFSTVDFEGEVYVLPGKADQYALDSLDVLTDRRMNYESNETIDVYVDTYYLNDGDDTFTGDLYDEDDLKDLDANFIDYLNDGLLKKVDSTKYALPGLLTKPFVEYYELSEADAKEYLAAKAAMLAERERLRQDMINQGYSQEAIENWFRYDYWFTGDEAAEG